ncbi:MAG TPA: ABC transporter permease [Gemmataceae bacterium]|nr:ABC transporter permease [Gemmataceae bacterium]
MGYLIPIQELLWQMKQHPEQMSAMLVWIIAIATVTLFLLASAGFYYRKYVTLVFKSLRRNLLRTFLTSLAVMVLVFVLTLVVSFLAVLDFVMTEKSKDLKAIVTERWQVPSQMPYAYAPTLEQGAANRSGDIRPEDSMTWSFYGGTIDPEKKTRENMVFAFAMDPRKLRSMMDDLEDLDPAAQQKLVDNKRGILIGREKLQSMNKRVGERIKVTSMNYKDIDLEFDIVGTFPDGRYNNSAVMNRDYLVDALDAYPRTHNGSKHPLADKSLNLVWLRVPDTEAFRHMADQIMGSSLYSSPAVKVETASSGIATWIEPYRDLLWGLKWLLVPTLLITMVLVIANAISISVRERRTEMAVLKVLGFSPGRILALVLGEAVLIGGGSGLVSAGLWYYLIHGVMGGIKFPIAFFPIFDIYPDALWWGLLFGMVAALAGSIIPAWSARTVKVSEVFAKVA